MIAHVGLMESGQGVLGESEDLVLELRDVERRHLRLGRGHVELARADLLRGHLAQELLAPVGVRVRHLEASCQDLERQPNLRPR